MKSVKFSALVAVAVIAASCAKEGTHSVDESDKVALEPMCIEASDESQTKTVLDKNGKSVNWTEEDKIAVYSNIDYTTGYQFKATDIKGNSATFNGEVPVGTESFFAVYPPERVVSVSAEGVTVNIPANQTPPADQTPAKGTFAEEHNITVAQGTKTPGVPSVGDITFNNVCSYVKFTVPAYVSDVKKVTITSGNAIAGDLAVDLKKASSSIVSNGKNSISMSGESGSFGAGNTFLFVIAPGTVKNFSIDIETNSGKWTRTVSTEFTATAGRPVNLGIVDFKIASMDATATHTYADDGVTLTGTNLVIKNLNIPDHLTGYVQKVHIDIIPEGQTTAVRSADITDFSTQTLIAVNSTTYPYLPKGNYTIKSTYTMSGGTTSRETTGTFSVPAPTFSVKAHTNYDTYYNNGNYNNAAAANAEDGSTIYINVTISSDILTKYASLIREYSYTIDDNTANVGENANQDWGQHEVFAKFTFDGVEASETRTCHVTGLPYTLQPTNSDWKATGYTNYVYFNNGYIQIKGRLITEYPSIQSKSFHIPSDINVITNFEYDISSVSVKPFIGPTRNYWSTLFLYIGGTKVMNHLKDSNGLEKISNKTLYGKLSTSNPYIKFEGKTEISSWDNAYSNIYKVEIKYSENK